MHTTIVEAADAPLAAVLGPVVGTWFADLHRSEGVDVVLGASVAAATGADRVEQLTLSDGRRLACDHVLVGIGVDPDLAWLAGSGLDPAVVRIGADGHTGAPGVFAAGDATGGGHWESAARQGVAAARAMLGLESPRRAAASFWSDLYDTRVHYLGHARGADATHDRRRPRAARLQRHLHPRAARRSRCSSSAVPTTSPPRERCSRPEPKGPP